MSIFEILFLAIILSIDAFLVSFSYGVTNLKNRNKVAVSIASGVAVFQGIMPILGAFFVTLFLKFIESYALYLAGIIFIILGIKLFIDAGNTEEETTTSSSSCKIVDVNFKTVIILSIATSIDAFAAGSSLSLLKVNIYYASSIIALVTFLNSLIGFFIAEKVKKISPCCIGKLGGVLLFLIGLKTIFL